MTDIEIARKAKKKDIRKIAKKINVSKNNLISYGDDKAKITLERGNKKGKLILVTATNPTPYGEGKTTVSIGIADALNKLGKDVIACLRQPSMGPVFGVKGGATGGGMSQIIPMEDINLHFTGDFHAITSANNLLAAAIYNHIYQGNKLKIKRVIFERCLDVNDRDLRGNFNITAASEMMVIFCLARDLEDLKYRIGNIIVGYNEKDKPVYAKQLKIEGALTVILKDAFYPNLVQTLENTPAIVHGGPFANIAHGCNTVKATTLSLSLADYVITEAGFGADLGAEKFLDIKCKNNNLKPDAIVLNTTVKALKYNGNGNLKKGLCNLRAHIDNLNNYNVNLLVVINKYENNTEEEIKTITTYLDNLNILSSVSTAYIDGGEGAIDAAKKIIKLCNINKQIKYLYNDKDKIKDKIKVISEKIYHAKTIIYSETASKKIEELEKLKLDKKPICIAKTQYSISDNKDLLGYPKDNIIHVKDIKLYNGANMITVLLGDILTMPGLPQKPNYEKIDIKDNEITGIF